MKKTLADSVLINLAPKAYYRATDVAREMHITQKQASSALRELSRGG